jgi:uncharacterized paraquat-inducible protein A
MKEAERIAAAIEIVLFPKKYKICEGCDSIVMSETRLCPVCHSYRFNNKENEVMDQAMKLSEEEQTTVTKEDLY